MIPLPSLKLSSSLLLFATLLLTAAARADEAREVKVGAAHFPPYTVRPEQGADTGLLPQLVEALNRMQGQYRFVLVPTSIPRRFGDFQQGRTDMAIFENPQWGWQGIAHKAVDMGLEDAEIFVTRRQAERDQRYFDELDGKRLALFNGYHYAFADFNPDPAYLKKRFRATLTYSHDSNLNMVERGRADIALVTRSYLIDFLKRNPESVLMASTRVDQVYHHYALLRPDAPISPEAFAGLLRGLRENGELLRIFQPYQITVQAPHD
ncbi:substrate-binding periplasmic protein [Pseudomonas xantholysinigenes]|uniref:Transporter substrate-binding domain-containing protein n=1 Tax=Pseudomonas xantholysinigenes TaxID=2745490 RepID=A0A9E6PU09_9PSED|nr:transporter substrate-binding domain-containing protein [Pseudomonas xantholysinigenes]QXI36957.1 transporter substrate-binding domain-containing protein [Pseudomonas xantholysinigenes]